jgi:DNA-binding Xre family transcriptional regulator
MILYNLEAIEKGMARKGIANRKQLGAVAGLSLPTAYAIAKSGPLTRIDVPTLEAIARALDVNPLTLLRYEP